MDTTLIIELITVVTLLSGLLFGIVQVRHFRALREREAVLELVHSFQTLEVAEAIFRVMELPDGLSRAEVEERMGGDMRLIWVLWSTWERLGVVVFRGEIGLALIEDFFSGPVVVSWRKLRWCVEDYRRTTGRETMGEWFQWLAERIEARESRSAPVPANIEFADWVPA